MDLIEDHVEWKMEASIFFIHDCILVLYKQLIQTGSVQRGAPAANISIYLE